MDQDYTSFLGCTCLPACRHHHHQGL